ncbi:uncharacterized protein CLAFUR5_03667 [Fulvia fulva]|uniref:F-box domain-containing protein n=1 Tax=Passalora fulva TaxID=5499 RepID=A0A9Q8P4Y5_PASFU|nr:uncharacterized protein CLAFUR5_03667 [Fulvia fulva]UJO13202.1 hypothetical protein CLAFUR5_03667 [Fulvia fulva]
MVASLEGLPAELLARVVHYVPRPAHLKSLCLVSKTLQNTATPARYRYVELDEHSKGWPDLEVGHGLLSADKPGLAHVRELCCWNVDPESETRAAASVRLLLQYLPWDSLATFHGSDIPIDKATLVALLTQQTRLKHLILGPLCFDINPLLQAKAFTEHIWAKLETLSIPKRLDSVQDLVAYRHVIRKAPRLRTLQVSCHDLGTTDTNTTNSSPESPVFGYLFPPTVGGCLPQPPLKLQKLMLRDIDLTAITSRFSDVFDIHSLQSLEIDDCLDWPHLLTDLAGAFAKHGSSLHSFCLTSWRSCHEPVEQLLRSVKNLRTLHLLSAEHDNPIALNALDGYLASLVDVFVVYDWCGTGDYAPGIQQLHEAIATKMPCLERLGVALPPICILDAAAEESSRHMSCLRSLVAVPKLELLRIVNWPSMPADSFADPEEVDNETSRRRSNRALYQYAVKDFMLSSLQQAFESAKRRPGSCVVCMDSICDDRGSDGAVKTPVDSLYFTPGKEADMYGNTRVNALQITVVEARYFLECDDMFWAFS